MNIDCSLAGAALSISLIALPAYSYSHVPLPLEELSSLAGCVAEGEIVQQAARRVGRGILTTSRMRVDRAAGDCEIAEETLDFEIFGGRLENGESTWLAGVDPVQVGRRYLVLLAVREPGNSLPGSPIAGPQGVIRLDPSSQGTVDASDLAGVGIRVEGAPGAQVSRKFVRPVRGIKVGTAPEPMSAQALFEFVSGHTLASTAAARQELEKVIRDRIRGPMPEHILTAKGTWERLEHVIPRFTTGSQPNIPTAALSAKFALIPGYIAEPAGRLPWNPLLNYGLDQLSMAQWNRLANSFIIGQPTGTANYGNFRNDIGGWVGNDILLPYYGRTWGPNELGVTIHQSYCTDPQDPWILGRFTCFAYGTESDVLMNAGVSWTNSDWAVRANFVPGNVFSAKEVLTHELGHGLGLAHSQELSIMRSCSTRRGWLPYYDDAVAARVRWPGLATYSESVDVRLVQGGAVTACEGVRDGVLGMQMSATPVEMTAANIMVGPFLIQNLNNQPKANVSIGWSLYSIPSVSDPGTEEIPVATTSHGTVQPGNLVVDGVALPLPPAANLLVSPRGWYTLTATTLGNGSAEADVSPYHLLFCAPSDPLQFDGFAIGQEWRSYLGYAGAVECGGQAVSRSYTFAGQAGQTVVFRALTYLGHTFASTRVVALSIVGPGGTSVTGNLGGQGGEVLLTAVLPSTGTYTLRVELSAPVDFVQYILQRESPVPSGTVASSITLSSSPNPSVVGDSVSLSAHVSGTAGVPTGSVTFYSSGNCYLSSFVTALGSVSLDAAGNASLALAQLPVGINTIEVWYSGDSRYRFTSLLDTSLPCIAQTVKLTALEITYPLVISKRGAGDGTIASQPAVVNCGTVCNSNVLEGTLLSLSSVARPGSHFQSWDGDCTGTGICLVTMDAARSVTANFTLLSTASTDLNADYKSDLLWRNAVTGQVYRMLMNGFIITDQALAYSEPNAAWKVVADADFNGDGVTDLLWRNSSTGQVFYQPFAAAGLPTGGSIFYTEPNAAWRIVAAPDLDGDRRADLLWYNVSTGQVYAMLMDGGFIKAQGMVYAEPNTSWRIVAAGDFAGSGKSNQLLWRNSTTGQVYLMTVLFSAGVFSVTGAMIYQEPNLAWKVLAAPDLDGDGRSDILWRNDATGQVYGMLMNGATIVNQGMIYSEPRLEWKIVAQGDYNGDGKADLLYRNEATGQVYMMLMNGLSTGAAAMVYVEPNTAWKVMGPYEYAQ